MTVERNVTYPIAPGGQELFVTEYRLMLADKLVNNLAYDTDREIQNLELLKLRFGESSMHHCDIMVRPPEDGSFSALADNIIPV